MICEPFSLPFLLDVMCSSIRTKIPSKLQILETEGLQCKAMLNVAKRSKLQSSC